MHFYIGEILFLQKVGVTSSPPLGVDSRIKNTSPLKVHRLPLSPSSFASASLPYSI
jgi:hypothetical protein